jgi:hypothetical protein
MGLGVEGEMLNYMQYTILSGEYEMAKKKKSLLESIPVLILLGILAGAVGGLGIGLMQQRSLTSSSTSSAPK